MDRRPLWIPHQRLYTDDKQAHEKVCHIICHQGITNSDNNETPLHYLLERPKPTTPTPPNAGKDAEQQKLSSVAGWNVKWYRPFG